MHLSNSQARRFYRLLDSLVFETDATVHIAERPLTSPDATAADHFKVLKAISEEPSFIDDFASKAPVSLSKQDKATLDQWHNMWSSFFYLAGFADNGNALFSTAIGMVEVTGISQEVSEIIQTPGIVETVLMPFENVITFGINLMSFPIAMGAGMQAIIDEEMAKNAAKPTIRTAEQFLAAYAPYREKKREEDWQELQRQIAREDEKRRGVERMPEGLHRGSLAGLTAEQRKDAITRAYADRLRSVAPKLLEQKRSHAKAKPVPGTLAEALADFTKTDLLDMLMRIPGGDGALSWKKQRLIDKICSLLESSDRDFPILANCLAPMSETEYEQLVEIIDAGGSIEMGVQDERLAKWNENPPFVFFYQGTKKDSLVYAVMPEVMEQFDEIDSALLAMTRMVRRCFDRVAFLCTDFYGMVSIADFTDMFNSYCKTDLSVQDIEGIAFRYLMNSIADFEITYEDDQPFICEPSLSVELMKRHSASLGEPEDDPELQSSIEGLTLFRRDLLKRHSTIPRRPFEEIAHFDSIFEYAMNLESGILLREWLDAHVPDREDDLYFADDLLSEIVFECEGPTDPSAIPQMLSEAGLFCDGDQTDDLLNLAMRFVNDLPCWLNNGYSPTQLHEMETGRRIFYNEDGRPAKVGRNDPCPCGSGKKYKKCCGR